MRFSDTSAYGTPPLAVSGLRSPADLGTLCATTTLEGLSPESYAEHLRDVLPLLAQEFRQIRLRLGAPKRAQLVADLKRGLALTLLEDAVAQGYDADVLASQIVPRNDPFVARLIVYGAAGNLIILRLSDVDALRISRYLARGIAARGRSAEAILAEWSAPDLPDPDAPPRP